MKLFKGALGGSTMVRIQYIGRRKGGRSEKKARSEKKKEEAAEGGEAAEEESSDGVCVTTFDELDFETIRGMIGCKTGTWDRLDLPALRPEETWREVASIELGPGDVLWESKVTAGGATFRTTIRKELFGPGDERPKLKVQVEEVDGEEKEL